MAKFLTNETVVRLNMPAFCVNATVTPDMKFDAIDAFAMLLYSVVFVVSVVGNIVMLLILLRNMRQKRRRVFTLLLHMNLADLITTCVSVPKEIVHTATTSWNGADWLCRVCRLFDVLGVYLSANVLVCISLDRFMSIMCPLYTLKEHRTVKVMLLTAWTVAIVSSLPQVFLFRVASHPCFPWYTQCISKTLLGETSPHVDLYNTMLNGIEAYFVPLIVICFCYAAIMIKISREDNNAQPAMTDVRQPLPTSSDKQTPVKRTKSENSCKQQLKAVIASNNNYQTVTTTTTSTTLSPPIASLSKSATAQASKPKSLKLRRSGPSHLKRAKGKTLRMTIVVVIAFLVCWTPYYVMATLHFLDIDYATGRRKRNIRIPELLSQILNAFACFNSSVNPYLYGYFSFNLRQEIDLLLRPFRRGAVRLPPLQRRFSSTLTRCDAPIGGLTPSVSQGRNSNCASPSMPPAMLTRSAKAAAMARIKSTECTILTNRQHRHSVTLGTRSSTVDMNETNG